ncbi:MAG: ATP-binding protein [Chloroflexi bacterium]|nr:ATP-binding protein [Chloroflexota bacterium]
MRFAPPDRYFREMVEARIDRSVGKAFCGVLAPDLLVLNDLGLHRLDHQQSIELDELVTARLRTASFAITSNRDAEEWLGLFDDPILAGSALDRLGNASYQLVIDGEGTRQRLSPHRSLLEQKEVVAPPAAH